jgi:hypothetical protein
VSDPVLPTADNSQKFPEHWAEAEMLSSVEKKLDLFIKRVCVVAGDDITNVAEHFKDAVLYARHHKLDPLFLTGLKRQSEFYEILTAVVVSYSSEATLSAVLAKVQELSTQEPSVFQADCLKVVRYLFLHELLPIKDLITLKNTLGKDCTDLEELFRSIGPVVTVDADLINAKVLHRREC